jgi:dihydroneopterin aldolase
MDTRKPPLLSHARLRALAPDPPATVRVQNLSTTVQRIGHDAWNRPHKVQPCLLSAEVAFAAPFASASATDRLGEDTVHYGTLSKEILWYLARLDQGSGGAGEPATLPLPSVVSLLGGHLTGGYDFESTERHGGPSLLDLSKVQFLSLTAALPKASLLGEGVKLTMSGVFRPAGSGFVIEGRAVALEISRLRVPTLIGVNDNERVARQFVVATVTIEGFTCEEDIYTDIEAAVVKVGFESPAFTWL